MKKTFIYLAAALVLASCAKNEVSDAVVAPVNSDIIGFNTSTGSTRAMDNANADALKTGFNVIGIDKNDAILFTEPAGEPAAVSSKFMFVTDKWMWEKETEDKKWPNNSALYPLRFIAAYPLILESEMGPWATPDASYTKSLTVDNTNFAVNLDLLAANTVVHNKPTTGTTPLNFKHILSKIAFQIVSPVDYKIFIQSVTINRIASMGRTYDYKTSTCNEEPEAFTTLADYNHVKIATGAPVALVGLGDAQDKGVVINSNVAGETWKLMPQTLTPAWDKANFSTVAKDFVGKTDAEWTIFMGFNPNILDNALIEVVYRMEDAAGKSIVGWRKDEVKSDGTTTAAENSYVKVAYTLNLSTQANKIGAEMGWLSGYSYTYQIKLGTPDATNGTVVDPTYKDDNGTSTDKPIDNPATKPGEDITKTDSYIGFNVIVDEWIDNNIEIK